MVMPFPEMENIKGSSLQNLFVLFGIQELYNTFKKNSQVGSWIYEYGTQERPGVEFTPNISLLPAILFCTNLKFMRTVANCINMI